MTTRYSNLVRIVFTPIADGSGLLSCEVFVDRARVKAPPLPCGPCLTDEDFDAEAVAVVRSLARTDPAVRAGASWRDDGEPRVRSAKLTASTAERTACDPIVTMRRSRPIDGAAS